MTTRAAWYFLQHCQQHGRRKQKRVQDSTTNRARRRGKGLVFNRNAANILAGETAKGGDEQRRWEEEKRLCERELEEERRRREEEMLRREEQTQRQMEILQTLVEGVQMQGEAATRRAEKEKDVRVPKLTEEDDIVAYLTTFERLSYGGI